MLKEQLKYLLAFIAHISSHFRGCTRNITASKTTAPSPTMNPLQITARQAIAAATQRANALALVHGLATYLFLIATTIIAIRLYTKNRWPWQGYLRALPCLPYLILSSLIQNITQIYAHIGLEVDAGRGEQLTMIPQILPSTCEGMLNSPCSWPCRYEQVTSYMQTFDGTEKSILAPGFLDIYEIGIFWPLIALASPLIEYKLLPWVQRRYKEKGIVSASKLIVSCCIFFVSGCCGADALLLMEIASLLAKWTWGDDDEEELQIVEEEDDMDVVIDVAGT